MSTTKSSNSAVAVNSAQSVASKRNAGVKMWICLIGAPTCKRRIYEDLINLRDFKPLEVNPPKFPERHPESAHLNLLDQHYRLTIEASQRMNSENIVSISSFWSQHLVYAKALLKTSRINALQFDVSESLYASMAQGLEPPSFFIYVKASHIAVRNRANLKNEEDLAEDWVDAVLDFYEEHVPNIRVPVIEVEAENKYDKIWNDIDFDVSQMQTTRAADQTLWRRTMFRGGYT